ncbi:MAG: hypothetical protein B7Y88_04200 [Sphingomonadales bacterium 32-64-17]|nr:MAG: hypothetical protein B7Y88_04200 [Sphingomonadales bacterium 32-64-17]
MLMRVVGPCRAMAEQVERGEIVVETAMKGFLDEEARLSGVRHSAFRALLPPSWEALPTSSQLVHFEKAFAKVDRDPAAMEPGERYEMECWLTEVCEAFGGEQDGYRAQRLLEEMDG